MTVSWRSSGIGSQNLTGSFTENARIPVTGDPGSGNSGDPYAQFNTGAFAAPQTASKRIVVNATMGPGIKIDPLAALSVEAAE